MKKQNAHLFFIAILVASLTLTACESSHFERVPFETKTSSMQDWVAVFKNPRPINVKSFITGTITGKKSGIINYDHPRMKRKKG